MASKRSPSPQPSGSQPKRPRPLQLLTLREKVEMLVMLSEGKTYAEVAAPFGSSEHAVCCLDVENQQGKIIAESVLGHDIRTLLNELFAPALEEDLVEFGQLKEIMAVWEVQAKVKEWEENEERANAFVAKLDEALQPYTDMLLRMYKHLKLVAPPEEEEEAPSEEQ